MLRKTLFKTLEILLSLHMPKNPWNWKMKMKRFHFFPVWALFAWWDVSWTNYLATYAPKIVEKVVSLGECHAHCAVRIFLLLLSVLLSHLYWVLAAIAAIQSKKVTRVRNKRKEPQTGAGHINMPAKKIMFWLIYIKLRLNQRHSHISTGIKWCQKNSQQLLIIPPPPPAPSTS